MTLLGTRGSAVSHEWSKRRVILFTEWADTKRRCHAAIGIHDDGSGRPRRAELPRDIVGLAAGRERYDEPDRAIRIVLLRLHGLRTEKRGSSDGH